MQQLFADVCIIFLRMLNHNSRKSAAGGNKLSAPARQGIFPKLSLGKLPLGKLSLAFPSLDAFGYKKKPAVAAGFPGDTISEIT